MDRHPEFRLTTILVLLERRRALDMKEPDRTLLDTMVNEVMDAHADTACGGGNRVRLLPLAQADHPVGDIMLCIPQAARGDVLPGGLRIEADESCLASKRPPCPLN